MVEKCGSKWIKPNKQSSIQLFKEGVLSAEDEVTRERSLSSDQSCDGFDVLRNLWLLPKCSKKDAESFFSLFEGVADAHHWLVWPLL